jgi:protein phosphatase
VAGFDDLEHASLTDVGVRRSHNQDSHGAVLAADPSQFRQQGHIFLVADGMGAHAVGEMASRMAVDIIPHIFHKHADEGVPTALRKAFDEANASIHARGKQNKEFEGMGTTATALILRPEGAWVGHVGDSRVYRLRADRIEQLSYDHSLVWEVARRQKVDPDGVEGVRTNVIVRSLGPEPKVKTDIEGPHPLVAGDRFLLCSDGLSGQLSDHEIGAVASVLGAEEACRFLIDLANLRGGPDNITVQIIQVGAGVATSDSARPQTSGPPWYRRLLPWTMILLILGVLLAAAAMALTVLDRPGGELAFLLSAGSLILGLGGLLWHHRREQQPQTTETYRPRTRAYRQASCKIDRAMVDKLAGVEKALRQRARDRKWDVDWETHKTHLSAAEAQLARGDFPAAFRHYCQATRPLTRALAERRQKEEVFQPHWDKT